MVVSSRDITRGGLRVAKKAGGGDETPGGGRPRSAADPSARHRRTLAAVFARPTRGDIPWRDIEALFVALGGSVTTGRGSRRRVKLGERHAVFHEPHPEKVTDKGAVD